MTPRFWLLQALGWSLFLLIAYIARPSEASVPNALAFMAVAVLSMGGMLASLALRWLYRKLQADGYGELRWFGILLVASALIVLSETSRVIRRAARCRPHRSRARPTPGSRRPSCRCKRIAAAA